MIQRVLIDTKYEYCLSILCSCSTYLGRPCNGGRRTINLAQSCGGGSKQATPAHEIMHTMGRYHDQTEIALSMLLKEI